MRKLSILFALALLIPAAAQAKSLEELLVEKGVITKAEAMGSEDGSQGKVYWNKGTRLEFPDKGFSLNVATLLQPRYEFTDGDGDVGATNSSSFSMRRARVILSGNALSKEFSYLMKYDLVGDTDAGGEQSPRLLDGYLTWHACDTAWARIGQWKTGVSRQFVNSAGRLQFADRSAVSEEFDLGRQHGAAVGGEWMDGQLTWSAGIYNGQSAGEGINRGGVDTNHAGVLNLRYNWGDIDPYTEGDVDWTDELASSFGFAYAYSENKGMSGVSTDQQSVNADLNMKYQGLSMHGEFYYQTNDPSSSTGGGSADVDNVGFYVQAGYFLEPKKFEIAARVGYVDYEDDVVATRDDGSATGPGGIDDQTEASASLNYYWWKHHLKAQFGYSFLQDGGDTGVSDTETNRWILQLTSWF